MTLPKTVFSAKIVKYAKICVEHFHLRLSRHEMNQQLPLHVHMHLTRPWVLGQTVMSAPWQKLLQATGP